MGDLKGAAGLKARFKALQQVFKPIAREWSVETRDAMRPMVPVRTGRLRRSIVVKRTALSRAVVGAHYTAYFVNAGTRRHVEVPKGRYLIFKSGGRTVFARKVDHPRTAAQPFAWRAAREGLRRAPMVEQAYKVWNGAD